MNQLGAGCECYPGGAQQTLGAVKDVEGGGHEQHLEGQEGLARRVILTRRNCVSQHTTETND